MSRFLLIHGAFAAASCWELEIEALEAAGHTARAIDLPGSGEDTTPLAEITLDAYADRVCAALAEEPEPPVLVGHSMGGMVITQAAGRCPELIASLVYVCAFLPQDGQSLLDLTQTPEGADDKVQEYMVVEGDPPVARMPTDESARAALFSSCNDEQAAWGVARLGPQAAAPFLAASAHGGEAFAALPRSYVLCTLDRAIPPALQRRMVAENGIADVVELDADHAPYLMRIPELTAALTRFAGGG
jgi:pimeloyl-ACP methyl ester carboxylesterase